FGDNVGEAVVDDDLDFDVGVYRQELCELRQQDRLGGVFHSGDPNGAGGLFPKFSYGPKHGLDLLKTRSDGVKQALAWFRRPHATRSAAQQSQTEPVLQPTYRVAQRGLRYAELRRGVREATLLRQ